MRRCQQQLHLLCRMTAMWRCMLRAASLLAGQPTQVRHLLLITALLTLSCPAFHAIPQARVITFLKLCKFW